MRDRFLAFLFGSVLIVPALVVAPASSAPFAAKASVSPQVQYLGDSTGTTFTFTVENTGTSDSIGAVQITRPANSWTIIGCPGAPAGWTEQRSDTMCRYRSASETADDIAPGTESSAFQVTATVAAGTQNITGTWSVKVSRSSNFDTKSKLTAAASEPPGLGTTAYSFQVLDAVVDPATTTPGAACPAPSKSAITGSTGHTVVICGRNRTTGTLTPTSAQSSLAGTFVASHGGFSSGAVAPTATSRVLGSWANVTITSSAGPNKTVLAKIGSAANRTSPVTTLTGYEALNNPPDAVDDIESTDEDNSVSFDPRTNDSDPDGDPITITAVSTAGTGGTVTITGGGTGLTYDPNGAFDYLAAGESGTDTFTYTISDAFGATDTATVTVTVTGVNDPPNAVDDIKSVAEDSTGATIDVLANDTDPDTSDTLTVTAVDTTGTAGSVTNNGTDVTYDPNGQFEGLAAGATATDTFSYTASDGNGGVDNATVTITINGDNDTPNAVDDSGAGFAGTADAAFTTGNVLTNDTDPDGDTLAVDSIDTTGTQGTVTDNGDGTFEYDPSGAFDDLVGGVTDTDTFTYTVTDGNGGTDTAVVTITITGANHAPNAVDDTKTVGEDNTGTTIEVLANDTDFDGDTLSVIAVDTTGTLGSVTNNGTDVTYDPNGQFEALAVGETDTDTFTYTASDGVGGTDTATVTVTITGVNDDPNAVDDIKTVGEDNTGTTIAVRANDTDPDTSDTLTVTAVDTTGTAGSVTNNGTDVTYDPNGQFESLAADETDTDTFTYTISDGNGGTDTATVTVTITGVNDAPNAVDDTKTVGKSDPGTTIDVLANDTDADTSDTLSVTAVDTTGTLGTVANNGTDVTYDPNGQFDDVGPGDEATDTFTYTVSDGNGGTDTATVTITVTAGNATPTADNTSASGNEDGGAITVNLSGDDPNGDALTFTAGTATHGLVTVPGSVSCTGAVPNHCTATSTYTPNANFYGSDSFTYTVNDGTVDSSPATASITVNPVNDAPSFTKGANQTVLEDAGAQTVNGWATAISSGPANESTQTVSFVVTTDNDGLFSTLPDVSPTGTLTYTPAANAHGVATVTLKIVDSGGTINGGVNESATQQFTITVTAVNDAPVAAADSTTTDEDSAPTVNVLANDSDADGDTLVVSAVNTAGTVGSVTITNAGADVTYDTNGQFESLAAGQTAQDVFTYTVADGNGGTDTETVTMTITGVNDAPTAGADTFNAIGNTGLFVGMTKPAGQAGKEITGSVLTNDTDPDTAHASLVAEPVTNAPTTLGGTITIESDGNFTYHPDDGDVGVTDTFTYRVCDASPCTSGTVANSTGTLNLPLTGQVWYVKNNQAVGGDGTSDTPFDTLAEAETASGAGDTTFVYDGDNTTSGLGTGYSMDTGESLIGEVAGLSLDPDGVGALPLSPLYPAAAGATPTLTTSAEDVVSLAAGTLVDGFNIDPGVGGGGIGGGVAAGGPAAGNVTIANIHVNDTATSGAGTQPGLELNGTTGTNDVRNLEVDNGGSATAIGVKLNSAGTVNFAAAGTISVNTSGAKGLDAAGTAMGAGSVFDDITVTGSGTGGVNLDSTTGSVALGDGTGSDVLVTTTSGASPALRVNNATNVTVAAAGTDELHATGGPALDITGAGTYAFDLVDSTNSSSSGVILMNIGAGTVDIDDGTISGYTAWGLNHSGGTGNVDMGADIADGVGINVAVINRTGGSVTFTGAVSDSGDASGGAWAIGNSNTTVRFEGGIALSTGTTDAFAAIDTGTVVVTDPNGPGVAPDNTVTSTTGRAVVITGTTIGSDGVTFRSIASNGAASGIVLTNTGSGRLIVTGNGGTCSSAATCTGGAIQNSTGAGIALTTVPGGASLTRMAVTGGFDDGIRATTVNDLDVTDSVVLNNGNSHAGGAEERGLDYLNVTGTPQIVRTTVSGSDDSNAHIRNTVAGTTVLTVDQSVFSNSKFNAGLRLRGEGPSVMTATVTGSTFSLNADPGFSMQTDSVNTAQQTLLFNDNDVSGGSSNAVSARPQVSINADGASTVRATVTNNDIKSAAGAEVILNTLANHTGTFDAKVNGNEIGDSQPGALDALADGGSSIWGWAHGDGVTRMEIRNNSVANWGGRALELSLNDGVGDADYTVTGNVFTTPDVSANTFEGIYIVSGGAAGDAADVCVDLENNDMDGIGRQGVSDVALDRFTGNLLRFADFNDTSVPNLQSNLRAKNPLSAALTVETFSNGPTATTEPACDLPVGTP